MSANEALIRIDRIARRGVAVDTSRPIWRTHTGEILTLNQMETSHLVNILRQFVNKWAEDLGLEEVDRKEPVADIAFEDRWESQYGPLTAVFFRTVVSRCEANPNELDEGYRRIWFRVVNKAWECLYEKDRRDLEQKVLSAPVPWLNS